MTSIKTFTFPEDAEFFTAQYWTVKQAAEAWGVHYTTALHLIERHAEALGAERVRVIRPHGDGERTVIPRGSARPSAQPGNPNFRDPDYQRELAQERWDRERTEAELIRRDVEDVKILSVCRSDLKYRQATTEGSKVDFDALYKRIEEAEARIGKPGAHREAAAIKADIAKGGGL